MKDFLRAKYVQKKWAGQLPKGNSALSMPQQGYGLDSTFALVEPPPSTRASRNSSNVDAISPARARQNQDNFGDDLFNSNGPSQAGPLAKNSSRTSVQQQREPDFAPQFNVTAQSGTNSIKSTNQQQSTDLDFFSAVSSPTSFTSAGSQAVYKQPSLQQVSAPSSSGFEFVTAPQTLSGRGNTVQSNGSGLDLFGASSFNAPIQQSKPVQSSFGVQSQQSGFEVFSSQKSAFDVFANQPSLLQPSKPESSKQQQPTSVPAKAPEDKYGALRDLTADFNAPAIAPNNFKSSPFGDYSYQPPQPLQTASIFSQTSTSNPFAQPIHQAAASNPFGSSATSSPSNNPFSANYVPGSNPFLQGPVSMDSPRQTPVDTFASNPFASNSTSNGPLFAAPQTNPEPPKADPFAGLVFNLK
jgi:hypothetical protein